MQHQPAGACPSCQDQTQTNDICRGGAPHSPPRCQGPCALTLTPLSPILHVSPTTCLVPPLGVPSGQPHPTTRPEPRAWHPKGET
mmetsp:Transcript_97463/g.168071  ORF Transcript_97463/g.168071 Transcript_97463/m.168071 type:complete len:85 (-) Transcript_97463:200-454(-)